MREVMWPLDDPPCDTLRSTPMRYAETALPSAFQPLANGSAGSDAKTTGAASVTVSGGISPVPPTYREAASSTSSRPARMPAIVGVTATCG